MKEYKFTRICKSGPNQTLYKCLASEFKIADLPPF